MQLPCDIWLYQVEVKYDLSAEEMLSSISEFSRSEGHGSTAALTILSHGYQRNIMGADNQSLCSIQEVVDSFNTGNVQNIKKVNPLSFYFNSQVKFCLFL